MLRPLTQAVTDVLGLFNGVNIVIVGANVEGVAVVLVLHPPGPTVALRAVLGLWGSQQFSS